MDPAVPSDSLEFRLNLAHGDARAVVQLAAPRREVSAVELLPILNQLDDAAVELARQEARRSGAEISCRVGCAACCRQLIPISEHEAMRIAQRVAALDEDHRRQIESRFEQNVLALENQGLLERLVAADELESEADRAELGHEYFALRLACPFLEDERCTIYAERPMACREYLVSSPPGNCWSPRTEPVEAVPVAATISSALYRFGHDGQSVRARWMPLALALRWHADRKSPRAPKLPGPELFRRFLKNL